MRLMTVDSVAFTLTLLATIGCGLIGGLFFAFSVAVMKALGRLPPAEGMAAMQAINVTILNPVFLSVFVGTAALCGLVVIASLLRWDRPGALFLLAGGGIYVVGTFLVTAAFNVPRNEKLASVAPAAPEASGLWADYLVEWTAWNHVRAVAAAAAATLLTVALSY
jgi:uncharacterized membrane protein